MQDNKIVSQTSIVKSSAGFSVKFKLIKNVADHDFPQASITWQALEEAGIDPGELVANGLKIGHGYEQEEYELPQIRFKDQFKNLLGETKVTDNSLVSYRIKTQTLTINDQKLIDLNSRGMSLSDGNNQIIEIEDFSLGVASTSDHKEENTLEFIGISKEDQTKIGSNTKQIK